MIINAFLLAVLVGLVGAHDRDRQAPGERPETDQSLVMVEQDVTRFL